MPNQPTPIRGTFTPDAPAPPKPNFLLQLGSAASSPQPSS